MLLRNVHSIEKAVTRLYSLFLIKVRPLHAFRAQLEIYILHGGTNFDTKSDKHCLFRANLFQTFSNNEAVRKACYKNLNLKIC